MLNWEGLMLNCQEPCALAQGVLWFLSTMKNAFSFCQLKQAGYEKSIFQVLKQVIELLPPEINRNQYRRRFLKEFKRYSDTGRKKGEPRSAGCVWELEGLEHFDIRNPETVARWFKEHQQTHYQKDNTRRQRDSFFDNLGDFE